NLNVLIADQCVVTCAVRSAQCWIVLPSTMLFGSCGVRSAKCGIAVAGRSASDPRPATPHSAFPIPHWAGRGGAVKIAVVFDTLHPDWEDADYKKEVDAKVEEAEYDVGRALLAQGHDVLMVGVADQLAPVLERLATFQPKLV